MMIKSVRDMLEEANASIETITAEEAIGLLDGEDTVFVDVRETGELERDGSIPGAMLGGLILGLVEAFWSGYFTIEYKDVASFSILVIVLIFLPTGLLGRPEIEKV